jgi:predicted membrane protein
VSSDDKFDPNQFREDLRDRIHGELRDRFERPRRGAMHVHLGNKGDGRWIGFILVVVGTAFLLDHMGIVSMDRIFRLWPVILIFAGAVRFLETNCNRVFSVLLILIGTLFLLGNLGYLRFSWGEIWPVALIAAGATMIWGRTMAYRIPARGENRGTGRGTDMGAAETAKDPNAVTATALFGGVERRITISNFKSGTISAMFGGVELDFRSADIEGEEAVLFVEAVFGGIELVVPERWAVIYEGQSIFGGYSDETRPPLPEVPGTPAKKRLILRGQALFGGITVKN